VIKAIRIHGHGGPDVMRFEDIELPPPGPGEVRVRHTAVALNFSDINVRRSGFYQKDPLPMPIILGNEAAAVVTALGPGVDTWRVGDRVGYVGMGAGFFQNTGSYAQERNVFAARLAPIPDDISDVQAASIMLKGLTVSNIINKIYQPKPGDTVLIHAAAGGVGHYAVQIAKHLGANVTGTSSASKKDFVWSLGADAHIDYTTFNWETATPVFDFVLDTIGGDNIDHSLYVAKAGSTLISIPTGLNEAVVEKAKARQVDGYFFLVTSNGEDMQVIADWLGKGILKSHVSAIYPFEELAKAHEQVESGRTTGKVVVTL